MFELIFFITLCDFLEFLIPKRFCRNFLLILTFSFYEYFTEVLSAAFYKILIKYFRRIFVLQFFLRAALCWEAMIVFLNSWSLHK